MPADCVHRVVSTKSDEILCQRPPPKIVLKEAWQVQHGNEVTAANKHREIDRGTRKSILNGLPSAKRTTESST